MEGAGGFKDVLNQLMPLEKGSVGRHGHTRAYHVPGPGMGTQPTARRILRHIWF